MGICLILEWFDYDYWSNIIMIQRLHNLNGYWWMGKRSEDMVDKGAPKVDCFRYSTGNFLSGGWVEWWE